MSLTRIETKLSRWQFVGDNRVDEAYKGKAAAVDMAVTADVRVEAGWGWGLTEY